MSQYKEGTVDVTNGSQTVNGTATEWSANVEAGDLFTVVDSGVVYEVAAVVSDTELTLNANYAGATDTGVGYVIARDFTPIHSIPYLNKGDVETATILKRVLEKIDGLL